MSEKINQYLEFIKQMNNNYVDTIKKLNYKSFITGLIDGVFKRDKIYDNINVNFTKPKVSKTLQIKDKKELKKDVDFKIERINIHGGLTETEFEETKKRLTTNIDEYMSNPDFKIDVNIDDYEDMNNKLIYNNITTFIREKIINELLIFYINKIVSDIPGKRYVFENITNKNRDEIRNILNTEVLSIINNEEYILYYEVLNYQSLKKPIRYVLMYLLTMYLSTYKNWDNTEYKQNFYLFFILFFELNRYFNVVLMETHCYNNIDIILSINDLSESEQYVKKINVTGACSTLSSRKLIDDITNKRIEDFENRNLQKTFQFKKIIGLNININDREFPEVFLNILYQFMIYRYSIWLLNGDPLYYDKLFDIIIMKTYKRDENGDYIFSKDNHYTFEASNENKYIMLTKIEPEDPNTIEFFTYDCVNVCSSLFNGCYLDLFYGNNEAHRIGIIYTVDTNDFVVYDPNHNKYHANSVNFKIRQYTSSLKNAFVLIIQTDGDFYKKCCNYKESEVQSIKISPMYSSFIVNENYFKDTPNSPLFNIYHLNQNYNSDDLTVETGIDLYNYNKDVDLIETIDIELNNSCRYLFYDEDNKKFYYYVKNPRSPKSRPTYYKHEIDSDDFLSDFYNSGFYYQQENNLIIHDLKHNVYYLMLSQRYGFIKIEDIEKGSDNFKIYDYNKNGFYYYSDNVTESSIKLGINPLLKMLNINLKTMDDFPLVKVNKLEKMNGGVLTKKMILFIIVFVLITIIIICIVIYYVTIKNKESENHYN